MPNMFEGRNLVIATKHKKEDQIAPILKKELGVVCMVPQNFDTDMLGTFSGEVEREFDPLTTARKKCEWAMLITDSDLAIASEGSFGPHPSFAFIPADEEWLVFIDKRNELEIVVREISTTTNFAAQFCKNRDELEEFAKRAQFPGHGLIMRTSKQDTSTIVKDIRQWDELLKHFSVFCGAHGGAYVETDMRAMHNPMRMDVIKEATKKLVNKIKAVCPQCHTPGFGITNAKPGLPCNDCGSSTKSTLYVEYTCQKCTFTKQEKYPNKKQTEDPMYCDQCNP